MIAVQCRKDDFENLKILEKMNDENTKICALTERSLLKTIGGDCHTAVGAYAKIDKDNITIIGLMNCRITATRLRWLICYMHDS